MNDGKNIIYLKIRELENKRANAINKSKLTSMKKEKLNKINDTPFYIKDVHIELDNNIFLPMNSKIKKFYKTQNLESL